MDKKTDTDAYIQAYRTLKSIDTEIKRLEQAASDGVAGATDILRELAKRYQPLMETFKEHNKHEEAHE